MSAYGLKSYQLPQLIGEAAQTNGPCAAHFGLHNASHFIFEGNLIVLLVFDVRFRIVIVELNLTGNADLVSSRWALSSIPGWSSQPRLADELNGP